MRTAVGTDICQTSTLYNVSLLVRQSALTVVSQYKLVLSLLTGLSRLISAKLPSLTGSRSIDRDGFVYASISLRKPFGSPYYLRYRDSCETGSDRICSSSRDCRVYKSSDPTVMYLLFIDVSFPRRDSLPITNCPSIYMTKLPLFL